MSNGALDVNYWMMDDPTQPKPAEIMAVLLQFREAMDVNSRKVDSRLTSLEGRLTSVEGRLSGVQRGLWDVKAELRLLTGRVGRLEAHFPGAP